jgi:hypothetical protein
MPKKKQHAMPSISLQPTARSTLPVEWSPNVYPHPEGDGQFYVETNCVGVDAILCLNDFDELKALQKAVNEAVEEEEALRS